MSDQVDVQQAAQPAPQQPVQPTQDQLMQFFKTKQQMLQQLQNNYNAFMDSLAVFPVMQRQLAYAMQNFETGFILLEKGMALVPFQAIPQPPVTPSQPSSAQAPSEEPKQDSQSNDQAGESEPPQAA